MNITNRRVFLTEAAVPSCGALWGDSTIAKTLAARRAAAGSESQLSDKPKGAGFSCTFDEIRLVQ
jgi:hypothetical protein